MSLSLAEFMAKVSEIIISYETAKATKHNEFRKRKFEALPAELEAKEKQLAELQATVDQARQKLEAAEKAGLDGIKDPFEVLKKWAEKHEAWKGWAEIGEVTDPRSIPPIWWVRRSRNLSLPYFYQYERMFELVKKGKKEVFKAHLERLRQDLDKAQDAVDKAQQSYEFYKEKYESLKAQVRNFAQDLAQLREELIPQNQEDLEDILEDVWNELEDEILALIPREDYTFEEEVHLTALERRHTIRLSDAVLNFETN